MFYEGYDARAVSTVPVCTPHAHVARPYVDLCRSVEKMRFFFLSRTFTYVLITTSGRTILLAPVRNDRKTPLVKDR